MKVANATFMPNLMDNASSVRLNASRLADFL